MTDLLHQFDSAAIPSFEDLADQAPVEVASFTRISSAAAAQITARYHHHGLCLIAAADHAVTDDSITAIATALELGPTFTPSLYRGTTTMPDGIARMCADSHTTGALHPSFGSTAGQSLHTDGTLESIGAVKTSLLLCAEPAEHGGATFFLNTTAIFADLASTDPAAAAALMRSGALVRISNLPGTARSVSIGPAFTAEDDILLTRLSLTPTDSWQIPDDESGLALMRGLATMIRARRDRDPRYYTEYVLGQGVGVLFANDRIGHGRHDYTNSTTHTRRMLRALYSRRPASTAALDATVLREVGR